MTLLAWVLLAQTIPAASWEERSPAAVGLSKEKLDALRDLAGGRGCVVRKGFLAYAWGDITKSADVADAGDPVLSTLLLMAVDENRLPGVDARVSDLEPRLTGKDSGITWRQLVGQVSGYGRAEAPGAAYAFNDSALALAYDTLTRKVFRQTGTEAFGRRLASALRFQDAYSLEGRDASGRARRFESSPRDFARFGLLILRGGRWGDRQVVSAPLTYLSISAPVPEDTPRASGKDGAGERRDSIGPGRTSFGWWLNGLDDRRRQLLVDGPGDLVSALGQGGRHALWILPSLDLVVSWSDGDIEDLDRSPGDPDTKMNRALRLMDQSVVR
jgi:CubicO group peptidase (beta-lactamase class C family)